MGFSMDVRIYDLKFVTSCICTVFEFDYHGGAPNGETYAWSHKGGAYNRSNKGRP